jgi:kinesin family member C1
MSEERFRALLQQTQATERESARSLSAAGEELANLRSSHAREVDELERTISRKDREKRNLEDEVREARDELGREREVVRGLKVSLNSEAVMAVMGRKGHLALSGPLVDAMMSYVGWT